MQRVSTAAGVWVVVLGISTLISAVTILNGAETFNESRLVYTAPILWWGTLMAIPGLMVARWGSYPVLGWLSAVLVGTTVAWVMTGIWSLDPEGETVTDYSAQLIAMRIFAVVLLLSFGLSMICLGEMITLPGSHLCVGIGRALQVTSVMLIGGGHLIVFGAAPTEDLEQYARWMAATFFAIYGLVVMGAAAVVSHYGAGRRARLGDVFAPAPAPVKFAGPEPAASMPMRPSVAPVRVSHSDENLRPPVTEAEALHPSYEDHVPPALFLDRLQQPPVSASPDAGTPATDEVPATAPPVRIPPPSDPTAPPANPFSGSADSAGPASIRMAPPSGEPSGPGEASAATPRPATPPPATPPPPDLSTL